MPPWYPLLGNYELTIDDKGRLLIPADIRKRFEAGGESDELILMNISGRAHLYPARYQLARFATIKMGIVPTPEQQRLMLGLFGRSSRLNWDKAGRILLSPRLLETFRLKRDEAITLVCIGDHIQLWPAGEWEADQGPLSEEMPDLISQLGAGFGPGLTTGD